MITIATNIRRSFWPYTHRVTVITLLCLILISPEMSSCQETEQAQDKKIFYMAINRPEGTPLFIWTDLIYSEVFRRMNMKLLVEYYPLKRASIQANSGEVDGEPARVLSYATLYSNLIRVDEPIFSMTVVAYAADPTIPELNGWASLKKTQYIVEYPLGMKICEDNLLKVLHKDQVFSIKGSLQGLQRVSSGRTDLYIDDLNSTEPLIMASNNHFNGKVRIAGTMESTPLYMHVHKKNRGLIPELEHVIRQIKSEGLVELYRRRAFNITSN